MWFKKRYKDIKLECYAVDQIEKFDSINNKNYFEYQFYFTIIEPNDITNKSWTEYTDYCNSFEIDKIYDGKLNERTGEITIL